MKLTHPTSLANFSCLFMKGTYVYFSYETPIAVIKDGETPLVTENKWGPTTGKHINYIKREMVEYQQIPHDFLLDCLNTL